jgi:hypothetical protein
MITIPSKPISPVLTRYNVDLCNIFPYCPCGLSTASGDNIFPFCSCENYKSIIPGNYNGNLVSTQNQCYNQQKIPIPVYVGDDYLKIDFQHYCTKNIQTCYECYEIIYCTDFPNYIEYYDDCNTTTTTTTTTTPPPNGCSACITPSSNDPSTVEYYGYASSPSWCACVGTGAVCDSTLVSTTNGDKIGYFCTIDSSLCLSQENGCIYGDTNCSPPYNFIASKVFQNPFNQSKVVYIDGSADDDVLLKYAGSEIWLRAPGPSATCLAGSISYQFTVGANESFVLEGWDIAGTCGSVNVCVSFDPPNTTTTTTTTTTTPEPSCPLCIDGVPQPNGSDPGGCYEWDGDPDCELCAIINTCDG